MNEADRKTVFRASLDVQGFLSTLLEDAQLSENDQACTDEREAMDSGTIYDCPDSTMLAAFYVCTEFRKRVDKALAACPDGALAGLDMDCPLTLERLGSDLYLRMAGHGADFRDRDCWSVTGDKDDSYAIGEALADLSKGMRIETHFGDDGKVYVI